MAILKLAIGLLLQSGRFRSTTRCFADKISYFPHYFSKCMKKKIFWQFADIIMKVIFCQMSVRRQFCDIDHNQVEMTSAQQQFSDSLPTCYECNLFRHLSDVGPTSIFRYHNSGPKNIGPTSVFWHCLPTCYECHLSQHWPDVGPTSVLRYHNQVEITTLAQH